ncbi:small-conductance mechanosensitive channel [Nostoc sp. ATCC 43529]|nr:small-conductance mechanosensitive channel [Nostoc sp. ATCC 43529]
MNPEASQTPEPIDEWLTEEEQTNGVENPTNPSVDSLIETAPINSSEDHAIDSTISNAAEVNSTVEPTEHSNGESAQQLEPENAALGSDTSKSENSLLYVATEQRVAELQSTEAALKEEIANLQASYKSLQGQLSETQTSLGRLVQESLVQLEQRKQTLQISIEQLERRQERIRNEMRTTFAGTSQDLAIRVQGFKDYLTGSLQDLAVAAEQLQLTPTVIEREREKPDVKEVKPAEPQPGIPQFAQQQFQDTTKQIRRLIDQYRNKPDYYGPAWQLRRTFEPVHAERVSNWFFSQGGRGALRTMGSRLQNILIASAAISILHKLYGDRVRTLVLANTPERLGEWRRGLQDCLGIGRPDFGPDRGVVLFEASEAVAQKADRLVKANQLPLIIIDDSEDQISLSLLQFPLWLAFAPDPKTVRNYDDDF